MAIIALVLGVLVAVGLVVYWYVWRASLPRVQGTLQGPGLSAPVEVLRDEFGVPHVYARTIEDAVWAQGYLHAQDRLFQMELNRRVASGRLSELFGAETLEADRFLRRVGLRRAAQRESELLDKEERLVLDAYARGVNAAVAAMGWRLPLELRLLRAKPSPWTAVDTLAYTRVLSLNLSMNWSAEALRARLVEKLGPERAALLDLHYPEGMPLVVPPGAKAGAAATDLLKQFEAARPFLGMGGAGASNNWAVSGKRSVTGKPLLANDPHLMLQAPSLWYEAHLVVSAEGNAAHEPELDVYGASLPGCPGVVIGHNAHVAWGFTNSNADTQDLFIEKFETPQGGRFEYKGQWQPAQNVFEIIKVRGLPDVIEKVVLTRHGPVVAGTPAGGSGPALALRWTAHDPSHTVSALLGMNRAHDAHQFREALRLWSSPSQNVVFADDQDNIGYVMAGTVPIRAKGTGLLPAPGWTDEYEWTGEIPFEELPQLFNPESGYIVTANNAVVGRDYKHHLSWDWMSGYRAKRIEELLTSKERLSLEDFGAIQMDVQCAPGLTFAGYCRGLQPSDPQQRRALEWLLAWDGRAGRDSVGAAVYETMIAATARRALAPLLGEELLDALMGRGDNPTGEATMLLGRYIPMLLGAIGRDDTRLLPKGGGWGAILELALADATALLRERLGEDAREWRWGRLHRLSLNHPMGASKALGFVFNGPNVAMGGDSDTPLQTAGGPQSRFAVSAWAPSWRQLVDLADPTNSLSVLPTGQSGQPGSTHYLDMFPLWYEGEFHRQWLDSETIERHLEGRLTFQPVAGR